VTGALTTFAARAGLATAAIGLAVLSGWLFDIQALKTIYGPITMKTNTAIAFLLCGTGLWLHCRGWRISASVCAGTVVAIAALTLSQHVVGWDLGIDQLLFREVPGAAATASPNRMGMNASTSFILAGTALILLGRRRPGLARVAQTMLFVAISFALLAVTGYIYGAEELYGVARYTGIALQTAAAFLILHAGILAASADHGAIATFASPGAAGTLLRRLTLPVVAFPLVLGYIVITAGNVEILDRGLGYALFAMSVIVILLAIMWRTAATLDVADRDRQRAQEAAEQANRLKDQFIAVLSHELRTPLNVMLGRLRLIESETDAERRARSAVIIARNGRLLARLIEDLLDLSRVTVGQFEIHPAPAQLNAIVKASCDSLVPAATESGITVHTDYDDAAGTVVVDAQRIQQVVMNLMSNAVRFTRPGGQIHVRTARESTRLTVTVSDTGIGFDGQFAQHLFEPFRQADSSTRREHGGLGLGLSIANHLAVLHGGSITASSPGREQGATFVLALPDLPSRRTTRPVMGRVDDKCEPPRDRDAAALRS
jgi:signal transduction histidine kinase